MIGFSTGCFFKLEGGNQINNVIDYIRQLGVKAIEISYINLDEEKLITHLKASDLAGFDYISLHAPALNFSYENNSQTKNVLNFIAKFDTRLNFNAVVVHPDLVKDWSIFSEFSTVNWATENMDKFKSLGRDITDITTILEQQHFKLVVDTQHLYTNDNSLRISDELQNRFANIITHYHVSGANAENKHTTLFDNEQSVIVESISKNKPVIIESPFISWDQAPKELNYVTKHRNQN